MKIEEKIINCLIDEIGIEKVEELLKKAKNENIPASKSSKQKEMEEFLLEKWNGMEKVVTPKYPNSIFYKKDGEVIMEQDKKNGYMWVSYSLIWVIFYNRFRLDYNQTQTFIRDMLEQHFKLVSLTPQLLPLL